jgi:hypothetical protein
MLLLVFPGMFYQESVGALFEESNYTGYYEADLYNEIDDAKNYDVVVEIHRYDGDYQAIKAYFNDKQYITFDEDHDNYLLVDRKSPVRAVDGKEYYLKLTDKKTEIPQKK